MEPLLVLTVAGLFKKVCIHFIKNIEMKNFFRFALYIIISIIFLVLFLGLILAFLPSKSKINNAGISPDQAAFLRQHYSDAHEQFTTTDGETLFFRRWNPDTVVLQKKDIAVLIFHGITAHSGAYDMAGKPISAGGYTTFGLDYRGHGLSGGNRGDSPGKERWYSDLAESVKYIKGLGFSKVIILGHSLGVASAICAANAVPNELAGIVLLSGAYESQKRFIKSANII
jgi:acylglycerol lipase